LRSAKFGGEDPQKNWRLLDRGDTISSLFVGHDCLWGLHIRGMAGGSEQFGGHAFVAGNSTEFFLTNDCCSFWLDSAVRAIKSEEDSWRKIRKQNCPSPSEL
jgi:hypothetical protein